MKVAHISDLHCCREHAEEALSSLRFLAEQIRTSPVDLVAISGDVWDASMLNTEASGFTRFVDAIRDIADLAPVAMIYGTPSHDTDGSLDIFRKITCKYGITVLEPGQANVLLPEGKVIPVYNGDVGSKPPPKALLFGIPEPRKKYLLAGNSVGKDETEETIRDAMHKMCFLLAAKRKEYSDIPCIVLYHGEVSGSVLQNDQAIERGTGIGITIDDLNDIGADYYALGHIHKPQQVGNLPAYYAGSIYPKNFGEAHKAGFNLVEFDMGMAFDRETVTRVDFPHPQNHKMEFTLNKNFQPGEGCISFSEDIIKGKKVWAEITCTKEQRALIDAEAELKALLSAGAVQGSRVTVCDIPVETVRAAEITEVNTPAKKFEVWAENSNITYDKDLIKKIESLETDATKGVVRAAGEWELVNIKLRGAIGIKKGIGKDEICLDFDNYSNGLIAITGANGKGKTTLIENCHPYPQLLTRKGKLQDHFLLRDSFRELIYRNRANGNKLVKFLIQIDGQNKSGSCKYFIFENDSASSFLDCPEWTPLPGVDGNLKPYEEELRGVFGPIDLYLRTAFITQRPTKHLPDLTDATAGEKKTLFVELAGIDYLQKFSEIAADKAKQEAAQNHDAEIKVSMLEQSVNRKDRELVNLEFAKETFEEKNVELDGITAQGKTAKADLERCQEAWNAEQLRQQKENDARRVVEQVTEEIKTLDANVTHYQEAAQNKAVFEQEITQYESLQKIVEAENEKKRKHLETNMEKQQGYLKQKSAHDEKVKALEATQDDLSFRKSELEQLISGASANIKLYERDASEIKENCPTCEQKLPEEKLIELKAKQSEFVSKIAKEKTEIKQLNSQISGLIGSAKSVSDQIADLALDAPSPVTLDVFDETVLRSANEKINSINIGQAREQFAKAQEATVRIDGIQNQLADKKKILDERKTAVQNLLAGIEEGHSIKLRKELGAITALHNELTERYTTVKAEIARQEAIIESTNRTLSEIVEQEKELETLKKQMLNFTKEETAWELISKAFGKDGIQALELDALAPGISDTANRILSSAYGDRFKIAIETTRMGGTGKKTKQIEDFVIKVIDSEDGEAVNLEDKSGGEAVWIKRAIYDAFSVIRKRNTNFAFLSCFQDETDGALDAAAKTAYCRMLEAAHAESKLRHTFIITHSNEVKAMIDQKIDMEELEAGNE